MSAGIYIDDSGTPGARPPTASLHADRKSWAAVIVPEAAASEVEIALGIFLNGIAEDFSARELHFTDIYGGRRSFRDVPIERRYELFDLMAHIFERFQLPILFQTGSSRFQAEIRSRIALDRKIGLLDLSRHEHLSLFLLLLRVRQFIQKHDEHFRRPLPAVVDEGLAKSGRSFRLPGWADVFRGGEVEFRRSHETPFLQLADFAAFAIARAQWLGASGTLKPRDREFLRIVSPERLCMIDMPAIAVDPETHAPAAYEELLKNDRRAKGLPDEPPLV